VTLEPHILAGERGRTGFLNYPNHLVASQVSDRKNGQGKQESRKIGRNLEDDETLVKKKK